MMYSVITLGRKIVLKPCTYVLIQINGLRKYCDYEHTRFRKKPKNGTRFWRDTSQIYSFNSWDNVEWSPEQEEEARKKVEKISEVVLDAAKLNDYEENANKYWDTFYGIHQNKFFKDRHWLFTEFPELAPHYKDVPKSVHDKQPDDLTSASEQFESCSIFEIGCGVGNAILPILQYNINPKLKLYGSDFSAKAIDILKEHEQFDAKRAQVFVLDATEKNWDVPFEKNSLDIIILIFVLSAINPEKMQHVANQIYHYLKPGGIIVFRDYGRYDLAQLRFKHGQCLQENFYVRGDGTRVYFFTQDEIRTLFTTAGLIEEQNIVDRRLQVNRGRQLTMYRVWLQAKYRKPV